MNKPKLTVFLRVLVSLLLLALLLWLTRKNLLKIWNLLSTVNILMFLLACLILLCAIIFMAWRLKIVLMAQNSAFSLKDLFSLTLIGYFFTNFMPTSLGGDLVKGYYLSKKENRKLVAYTSVFIDRVIGMFSVTLIASIALLVIGKHIEHKFIIWVIMTLLISCILFALSIFYREPLKKIGDSTGILRLLQFFKLEAPAKKTYQTLTAYVYRKGLVVKTLIISMAAQFISFFAVFLLAKSLALYLPFGKVLLVMPVIFVLCMLPVTMNGLGLREWAFVLFFSPNMGDVAAFSLSLLYLAMFLSVSLLGGIIYLLRR